MKKLLIVIDMQEDFVTGALANPDAQAVVEGIAALVKDFDGDVIATRDTHGENYLATAEGKRLPVPHCIRGTEGWRIVAPIARAVEERGGRYLDKPTFGYDGWALAPYDEIYLCGTCTDICVVSNALILKARYPETEFFVYGSLCAGVNQKKHEAALETMRSCQITVL